MDNKDYWVRKEAEIGEAVEAKFYCTYLGGDWPVKGPQIGVLFFSRSTLYFQSFHSFKTLASLFQPRRQDEIAESHFLNLPLEKLRCTWDDSPQTIWNRLLGPSEQHFVIHHKDTERDARSYRFSVDRKQLGKIAGLVNTNRSKVQSWWICKKSNSSCVWCFVFGIWQDILHAISVY